MDFNTKDRIAGLTAIAYKRKSQEDKSRQILSLETQTDVCDELHKHWSVQLVGEYAETKSAKLPDQRTKFTEMMKRIENGDAEAIVCWKIDRLVRNMKEGGWLIDLLQNGKLKAIITKEKVYLPEDNTIITAIEMAGATEYSRELSKKVLDGNAKKARKGIPNTHAVIGYLNNKHKDQGERDWSDDPERWHLIREVLRKILDEKVSPHQAYLWLRDDMKMTTPKRRTLGGKLLSRAGFYRFLKRTEIAGFFYHEGERYDVNGCITPMITEQEYWTIQERLGTKGLKRFSQQISTYSGYIVSPEGSVCTPEKVKRVTCDCGNRFSIKRNTECKKCKTDIAKMKNPIFYEKNYYYNSERKRKSLGAKGVPQPLADEKILALAQKITLSKSLTEWSQKYLHEIKDKEVEFIHQASQEQENYLNKLTERKRRAKDAYLDGTFTQEEYLEEKQQLEKEESQQKSKPEKTDWYSLVSELTTLGEEIQNVWVKGTIKSKRKVLEKLKSNFVWDEQNLNVSNVKWINAIITGLIEGRDEINEIEQVKTLAKQGDLLEMRQSFPTLCGRRESNSRPLVGSQIFYH
jgi:DNA invertase Pin-like site-specific DNA recombinase